MKKSRLFVAGVALAATASVLGGASSTAADAPEQGTLLSPRPATPYLTDAMKSASDTLVAYAYGQPRIDGKPDLQIRRISDGALVGTFPGEDNTDLGSLRLDHDVVYRVVASQPQGKLDRLVVYNPATQAVVHTLTAGPTESVIAAGGSWLLTCLPQSGVCEGRLRTTSGVTAAVPIALEINTGVRVRSLGDTAYVQDTAGVVHEVDVTDGSFKPFQGTLPDVVGPTRVFWKKAIPGDPTHFRVEWRERSGGETQALTVAGFASAVTLLPFGTGIAGRWIPTGGTPDREAVRPIDLVANAPQPNVALGVGSTASTPDGRIVVATADTGAGRIAAVGPGSALTTIAALPVLGKPLDRVWLSGGRVAGLWSEPDQTNRVYLAQAAGSQSWSTQLAPGVSTPAGGPATGTVVDFAGGTLLSEVDAQPSNGTYRLTWDTGTKDVQSLFGAPVLGHGGTLMSRRVSSGGITTQVVEVVKTGTRLAAWGSDDPTALDGQWYWHGVSDGASLVGTNALTGKTRQVATGVTCEGAGSSIQAHGRWVALSCDNGWTRVIDTVGLIAPVTIPKSVAWLGQGFVAWFETDQDDRTVVAVRELAGAGTKHSYGPANWNVYPAVDDVDRGLVYLDTGSMPRRVDLGWVASDAITAPTITSVKSSPRTMSKPSATATISYAAKAGTAPVLGYELSYRRATSGGAFGSWTTPSSWSLLTVTSVKRTLSAGENICFRVRATDVVGTFSPWSGTTCSTSPYDDRSLSAKGTVRRVSTSGAMSGTESQLKATGATLKRSNQRAKQFRLLAYCGPKEGSVKVYIGSTRLATFSLKCSKTAKVTRNVTLSSPVSGDLKLVSASSKRVRVDGVVLYLYP
ncbi:hypothetical protein [Aeromicrobium terrae]|uniref:Fibronectin type-III domain-containing protein n=1 Tax=Aeromicrobium terrae TaxID=2498846 RepID=A0A5C8NGE1_9ACTN|nr:hypothetical protein [Aeromicrobium terrae]TXL57885.1 hypothetical protein FHP06_11105 [Aeromicrobium terrae]